MKKTDNHYTKEKIQLRKDVISKVENSSILECFAGKGILYNELKNTCNINLISIEIEHNKYKSAHLTGDSFKYLKSLDLSNYNIIDLDAYGIPFKYIDYLFKSGFKGYVIVTAIQTGMGKLPKQLSQDTIKEINNIINNTSHTEEYIKGISKGTQEQLNKPYNV